MKKTLAILACTVLAASLAGAEEVVSSNTVGYQKVALTAGWNMVGVQFNKVGGEPLDLATFSKLDDDMPGFDDDEIFDTELRLWDGVRYAYYGWSGKGGTDVYDDPSYDNLWLDSNKMEADDNVLKSFEGAWVLAGTAGVMTVAGEVPTNDTVTVNLVPGWNIVANPFPGAVKICDFGQMDDGYAGFDDDEIFANQMRVWDGARYTYYGWSGNGGTDVYDDPSYDDLWLDSNTMEATEATVAFGHAVWINAEKTGTITFKNPTK